MSRRARRPWARVVAVAAVALTLAGTAACDGGATSGRPSVGQQAPDYEARILDGDVLRLASLEGDVVLLNVWATWCIPCTREMPGLEELHRRYAAEGLRVIGASVDRSSAEGQVRRFVQERDITFTILLDPDETVSARFRTIAVPETILIDRSGVIAYRWIGEFDPLADEVQNRIRTLLAADG